MSEKMLGGSHKNIAIQKLLWDMGICVRAISEFSQLTKTSEFSQGWFIWLFEQFHNSERELTNW
jgi:hypothetical protein